MWKLALIILRSAIGALALVSIFYPPDRLNGWILDITNVWNTYLPEILSFIQFNLYPAQASALVFLILILSIFCINYFNQKRQTLNHPLIGIFFLTTGVFALAILIFIGAGFIRNSAPPSPERSLEFFILLFSWILIGCMAILPRESRWIFGIAVGLVMVNELTLLVVGHE